MHCRYSGPDLVARATTTFGYLNYGKGYCRADGVCHAFPIIIGACGCLPACLPPSYLHE